VVIVPIGRGEQAEATVSAATELAAALRRAGIRTHVDDRPHVSPGFKFNDWEMRGVPIRLELGPRDLAAGTALMSRRLNYSQPGAGKEAIPLDAAPGLLHCGDQECEDEIKAETTATPRCIPLDGESEQGPCIRCGKPSAYGKRVIFARAY
jgi:prolyl-tRNA synthetase